MLVCHQNHGRIKNKDGESHILAEECDSGDRGDRGCYRGFLEVPKKYLKFRILRAHVRMDGEGYEPQDFTCRPIVS